MLITIAQFYYTLCRAIIFIRKIILMDSNNDSMLLLSWVNSQRLQQGQATTLYDLQHLRHTPFFCRLLQRVSPHYFQSLNHLNLQPEQYLNAIEEYLMEAEGKKIVRAYKKQIIENEAIEEIVKIVLHLLLQSEHKGEFISRIVTLSVEVQTYLMQEIKKVQSQVENFVQIKDILSTVERLEDENEALRNRLRAYHETNEQLSEHINESRGERVRMETEMQLYRNEKKLVYQELQISDLKDYVQLYRMIKLENVELSYSIQEMEDNRRQVEAQNEAMKDRIQEDYQTISHLQEEVAHLRQNYNAAREQISCLSVSYEHPDDAEDHVLRENKNIGNNAKLRMSFQDTTCPSEKHSLFLSHTFEEDESSENQRLRAYNAEIMFKLDTAYSSIAKLTAQVTTLREEKGQIEKKNAYLGSKLTELKKEHNRFVRELKQMGF